MNSLTTSLPLCSGIYIDTQVRFSTYYFNILLEQVLENIFLQQTHNDRHKNWFHNISPSKMSQTQSMLKACAVQDISLQVHDNIYKPGKKERRFLNFTIGESETE